MMNENLTDEQLLNITGGNAFLDNGRSTTQVDSIHLIPLYSIFPLYSLFPIKWYFGGALELYAV